ncbi:NAD(P)H nitroreductase [Mycolicibacterium duvalii]|uniref:Putative NAD(P)H nitroreductase acg n=1 Tax=Mycolicibacterium duvalii TaxID=39688 RepID=A0A7I7K4H6_9MYCO|nr:NAD(P)H nitroreductase [Mycolicibacterium duvalii]MCV7367915.1 NAD(P)H nitroreductase [Mycolicibacterium duvalii]PEG42594.1 NAD(P)H nitroreductase [Mycolicibacterium duvalii]BBX18494.1 putative NAD(P)H nitroreductase acg [Mycolicibacterium duvalii]
MRDVIVDFDVVTDAVALATRAPSLHNSQPWRWVGDGATVSLFLDDTAAPRYTDPTGRELVISCGAVLDHFRVAMAAAGWVCHVDHFPNPNNLDHLAAVDFSPMDFVTDGHRERAEAIRRRRTDRLPFSAPADWDLLLTELVAAAAVSGVSCHVVADDARPALIRASELTRSARRYESDYHAELVGWTADVVVTEGIPASALPSAAEREQVGIGRDFPEAGHRDRGDDITEDHAKVVVLSTEDSTRASALRCGELLSAVLLDATLAGLATCTLSHLTEVSESREIVTALTGSIGIPQLLVRIGSAPATRDLGPPTPRRPTAEVLEIRH